MSTNSRRIPHRLGEPPSLQRCGVFGCGVDTMTLFSTRVMAKPVLGISRAAFCLSDNLVTFGFGFSTVSA